MYRVDRNNYYAKPKLSTIYTPISVGRFIFTLVADRIDKETPVLDPCVGAGALLWPFLLSGYSVIGIDIEDHGFPKTHVRDYLEVEAGEYPLPSLVVMNPPFNLDSKGRESVKKYSGSRPLLPEVWMRKSCELFGRTVPMALFTPYGLRLNQMTSSRRWRKFVSGEYPEITSIISLPKNIFPNILFHSEILLFNISGLKAHYFYSDPASDDCDK